MYKQFIGIDGQISKGINRLNADGSITGIPADPANTDYIAYLEWCKTNAPLPADEVQS